MLYRKLNKDVDFFKAGLSNLESVSLLILNLINFKLYGDEDGQTFINKFITKRASFFSVILKKRPFRFFKKSRYDSFGYRRNFHMSNLYKIYKQLYKFVVRRDYSFIYLKSILNDNLFTYSKGKIFCKLEQLLKHFFYRRIAFLNKNVCLLTSRKYFVLASCFPSFRLFTKLVRKRLFVSLKFKLRRLRLRYKKHLKLFRKTKLLLSFFSSTNNAQASVKHKKLISKMLRRSFLRRKYYKRITKLSLPFNKGKFLNNKFIKKFMSGRNRFVYYSINNNRKNSFNLLNGNLNNKFTIYSTNKSILLNSKRRFIKSNLMKKLKFMVSSEIKINKLTSSSISTKDEEVSLDKQLGESNIMGSRGLSNNSIINEQEESKVIETLPIHDAILHILTTGSVRQEENKKLAIKKEEENKKLAIKKEEEKKRLAIKKEQELRRKLASEGKRRVTLLDCFDFTPAQIKSFGLTVESPNLPKPVLHKSNKFDVLRAYLDNTNLPKRTSNALRALIDKPNSSKYRFKYTDLKPKILKRKPRFRTYSKKYSKKHKRKFKAPKHYLKFNSYLPTSYKYLFTYPRKAFSRPRFARIFDAWGISRRGLRPLRSAGNSQNNVFSKNKDFKYSFASRIKLYSNSSGIIYRSLFNLLFFWSIYSLLDSFKYQFKLAFIIEQAWLLIFCLWTLNLSIFFSKHLSSLLIIIMILFID